MRVVMFYHSLRSCWNHGNAHFLRGVVSELMARGHDVCVYEPRDGWSLTNMIKEHGNAPPSEPLADLSRSYPGLRSVAYDLDTLDLDEALGSADLVLVHEWNEHGLVARIGAHRARTRGYRLLFHDTHHRSVTDPGAMAAYDLRHYDGVLAFGRIIRDIYLERGWAARAWTWHEAADVRVFRPIMGESCEGDVVWIGNWGDGERTAALAQLLFEPVHDLDLRARVYGVRYPAGARRALARQHIEYGGWLPNHQVPWVFARFQVTVHIPRQPYARALPGIPTIRPFEALACGIPLVSSPWSDVEGLFTPGEDFLVARSGAEMKRCLRAVLEDPALARALIARGRRTILERHTCGHRVDELLAICVALGVRARADDRPTGDGAARQSSRVGREPA